jgi:uroporphyrin-III C-methyltransferase/precorrin-2 dehydrogenase/sirohydrochlorin ferrochelatase
VLPALPLFHGVAGKPVIVLGDGEAARAKRRLVERAGGEAVDSIEAGLAKGARLAFVADDDPDAAREHAERLRRAGVLVNVVDRPELCDFTTPSILDRAPLLVAVGAGGVSAGLAKALRLRLETLLPVNLGRLAEALGAARDRLRARLPDASERRRALDAALAAGGPLDPLDANAAARVDDWLEGADDGSHAAFAEIRLRSLDPEDLTLREARLLGSADVLAHELAVPDAILDRARADAARVVLAPQEPAPPAEGLVVVLRI